MQNRGIIHGYACVSTVTQNLANQLSQLKAAGCEKVFREKITGTTAGRPQLKKLMSPSRPAMSSSPRQLTASREIRPTLW